jgi:hypothetical protein
MGTLIFHFPDQGINMFEVLFLNQPTIQQNTDHRFFACLGLCQRGFKTQFFSRIINAFPG